jgi:hypothetical protein
MPWGASCKRFFIPPRDSGEGGPRSCAVGGALALTLLLPLQNFLTASAPSTMLRMVPLPRYRGGGCRFSFPRCDLHPGCCSSGTKFCLKRTGGVSSCLSSNEGRRSAERRTSVAAPGKQAQPRSFATARLSALLRGYALRLFTSTRPGPRFLESPDANGRTLSDASAAAPCSPITRRTGRCPNRLQARSDELRLQEPLPLRQSRHRLTSLTTSEMSPMWHDLG